MARPQRYSNEQIIEALRHTKGMVYLAAKHLGCNHETISLRAKSSPKVAAELKVQRGEFVDNAELRLMNAVNNNEPWAILNTLKTIGKDRGYFEKNEIDINEAKKLTIIEEVIEPGQGDAADQTPPGAGEVPA